MANIKWNKRICITHLTELRSPFEERRFGSNGDKPRLSQMAERLRQMTAKQQRSA